MNEIVNKEAEPNPLERKIITRAERVNARREQLLKDIEDKILFGIENEVGFARGCYPGRFLKDTTNQVTGCYYVLNPNGVPVKVENSEKALHILRDQFKTNKTILEMCDIGFDAGGLEFKFYPKGFKTLVESKPKFEEFFNKIITQGAASEISGRGVHIHVDRSAFLDNVSFAFATQQFAKQIGDNKVLRDFYTLVTRRGTGADHTISYSDMFHVANGVNSTVESYFKNTSIADVVIPNSNVVRPNENGVGTFEFRCFHSCLSYQLLMACVEFVRAFVMFSYNENTETKEKQNYPDFLNEIRNNPSTYPCLINILEALEGKKYTIPVASEELEAIII